MSHVHLQVSEFVTSLEDQKADNGGEERRGTKSREGPRERGGHEIQTKDRIVQLQKVSKFLASDKIWGCPVT